MERIISLELSATGSPMYARDKFPLPVGEG